LIGIVINLDTRVSAGLHPCGRGHLTLPHARGIYFEANETYFVSGARLGVGSRTAEKEHRLIGDNDNRAAARGRLFTRPADRPFLRPEPDGPNFGRLAKSAQKRRITAPL